MKNFFSSSIFFALIISLYYFSTLVYSGKIIAICQKSSCKSALDIAKELNDIHLTRAAFKKKVVRESKRLL